MVACVKRSSVELIWLMLHAFSIVPLIQLLFQSVYPFLCSLIKYTKNPNYVDFLDVFLTQFIVNYGPFSWSLNGVMFGDHILNDIVDMSYSGFILIATDFEQSLNFN